VSLQLIAPIPQVDSDEKNDLVFDGALLAPNPDSLSLRLTVVKSNVYAG
jgi:hypothetical protein